MCKILAIAGLNPDMPELNWEFISEMAEVMSVDNSDGLGYAAIDENGELFCERWLYNDEAFRIRYKKGVQLPDQIRKRFLGVAEEIETEELPEGIRYNSLGLTSVKIKAVLLHTRKATNDVNINNTHPFIDEKTGTALIHNGVIRNVEEEDHIRSTCDSERILNKYLEYNIVEKPECMTELCSMMQGYMACAILAKDKYGYFMDLFRSKNENLWGVYIHDLSLTVYTTEPKDVRKVCKRLKIRGFTKFRIRENLLVRLSINDGEVINVFKFEGINKYGEPKLPSSNSWKKRSLGFHV